MKHEIKIQQSYLIHILEGKKLFEVRKNDRDYQVGDEIRFLPLDSDDYDCYAHCSPIPTFEITYVLAGFNGLCQGWVVLGIKEK